MATGKLTCTRCAGSWPIGTAFCGRCGTRLPPPITEVKCAGCGTNLGRTPPPYCTTCGRPIAGRTVPRQSAAQTLPEVPASSALPDPSFHPDPGLDRYLSEGEQVFFSIRPSFAGFVGVQIFGLVIVLMLGAILILLAGPGSFNASFLEAFYVLLSILAIIVVLSRLAIWFYTRYALTDRRILEKHGVLVRSIKDIPLDKIQSTSFEESLLGRAFGYGDLTLVSAGGWGASGRGTARWIAVPDPQQRRTTIEGVSQRFHRQQGD